MIRRRFGRRRRNDANKVRQLDVAQWLSRAAAQEVVPCEELEPVTSDEIPGALAVAGVGQTSEGKRFLVSVAPERGMDALVASLVAATAGDLGESGYEGGLLALAGHWDPFSRQALSLLRSQRFPIRAIEVAGFSSAGSEIMASNLPEASAISSQQLAAALTSPSARRLFMRAAESLEGLAAKYAGVVRCGVAGLELVLLARRVATLSVEGEQLILESQFQRRERVVLEVTELAVVLDRLEGSLRRRLNDGKIKAGEEGFRARLIPLLADQLSLRARRDWPLSGNDLEQVDFVALDQDGKPVVALIRREAQLQHLASWLEAWLAVRTQLPTYLRSAKSPLRLEDARLVIAAERFDAALLRVLAELTLDVSHVEVRNAEEVPQLLVTDTPATQKIQAPRNSRGPTHKRGRRKPTSKDSSEVDGSNQTKQGEDSKTQTRRFEEMASFDLDEPAAGNDSEPRGRGRGRGRSRRSSAESSSSGDDLGAEVPEGAEYLSLADIEREEAAGGSSESQEGGDFDDALEEIETPRERIERERAERRKERVQVVEDSEPEPPTPPKPRRAAIVAHADRDSLLAAVLLAREIRLLEGLWVYSQEDLMTFFRSVATDLKEETPIYVIGFTASPARDVLQAVALYEGRLTWFDHHSWPPEDVEQLKQILGLESVNVESCFGSSLPLVLAEGTRRSRFSDKLVDLATGRFSDHDFRRWGRVWWQRLAEYATRSGERRGDIAPLLTGRSSELAEEAAKVALPAAPAELAYVESQDFRLVHFGGFTMVVLPVPEDCDVFLAARIARDRYQAALSLAWHENGNRFVLVGGESSQKRAFNVSAMAQHLGSKHRWIETLPSDDHVARMQLNQFAEHPERLEAMITEIAMGRSILEG